MSQIDFKEKFLTIYNTYIKREGAEELLEYLLSDKCDFFRAPASTRFHGSHPGGLVEHSINVYENLSDYIKRPRVQTVYEVEDYSEESIAIVGLLHDICKVNFYKESLRNVKNEVTGQWEKQPFYQIEDTLPYGHGEKSVYIISGYMRLSREEAFAIRYHMGFSGIEDKLSIGKAFQMYPLAFAASVADMEATYFLEE